MNKLIFIWSVAALALFSSAAQAGKWRPTDAESDAFVRAYAFTVMQALMDEALDLKVEAGTVPPAVAACLRQHMQLENLLVPLRPVVAGSFTSKKNLARATTFFSSPTGVKIKQFGARQLRDALRKQSGAKPSDRDVQFTASREDMAAADKFTHSTAGTEFTRFVDAGLPRLGQVDVFGDAVEKCVHEAGGGK